jgi:hypothetical protein
LLYEKELSSFPQLIQEIRILDCDGGIRTFGKYAGKKCLVFLTRSEKGSTVAIYSIKKDGKAMIPDKRLHIEEVESEDALKSLLDKTVSKPVKAYSY